MDTRKISKMRKDAAEEAKHRAEVLKDRAETELKDLSTGQRSDWTELKTVQS